MRGKADRCLNQPQVLLLRRKVEVRYERIRVRRFQLGFKPVEIEQQLPQLRRPSGLFEMPRRPAPCVSVRQL